MNTPGGQAVRLIEWFRGLSPWQSLVIIVLFALFLRVYIIASAVTISVDGATDLGLARAFVEGRFSDAIDPRRPPLYPLLVSLLYPLTGELELSARLVSLVFGLLIIPLGFWLGRTIYDERTGILTAFFISLHPYLIRYSGETLRETTYCFFAMLVVGLAMKAVMEKRAVVMILVGVVSALAYLNKHVSLGFLMIFTLWIALRNLKELKRDWHIRAVLIGCGWLVFVVVALFYLVFLYERTGTVTITAKVAPAGVLYDMLNTITLGNSNLAVFFSRFPEALSVPFLVFFVWYLAARRREGFTEKERFVLFVILVYTVVHMLILPERRYFVRLTPFIAVFVAWGFERFTHWAHERFRERAPLVMACTLVAVIVAQLYQGLTSLHAHRLAERLAGRWILENHGTGATVLARKPIVSFYADANFVHLKEGLTPEELGEYIKKKDIDYIAGYEKNLKHIIRKLDRTGGVELQRLKSFEPVEGRRYVVYGIVRR